MSKIALSGASAGSAVFTFSAPATNTNRTLTLPDASGTLLTQESTLLRDNLDKQLTLGTAQASTSGTAINFTGIPSWAKRITLMFNGVSTSGTSHHIIQLGSGTYLTTGYIGYYGYIGASTVMFGNASGFGSYNDTASDLKQGLITFANITGNVWVCSGSMSWSSRGFTLPSSGSVSLSNTLDRLRVTTVNGTDTFDAGTINIMWE